MSNVPLNVNCVKLKDCVGEFKCSMKTGELFHTIYPKLRESFSQALDHYFQCTDNDNVASSMTSAISTISETVDLTFKDSVDMEALRSVAIGVLQLLIDIYTLLKKREHLEISSQHSNIMELDTNLQTLRWKIIGILISNEINYFPDKCTIIDVKFFNQLVLILCEYAELASIACDAKSSVEVWKCITKLCTRQVNNSIERFKDTFGLDCKEYLSVSVKTACSCIESNIKQMHESANQENKQIFSVKFHDKSIKFLTTILQKLAFTYRHDKFRGHEHVLTILLIVMRTANQKNQPFDEAFHQSIISGLLNVVFMISKTNIFVECFYQISSEQFSSEILYFGLQMLQKLLGDHDHEFLKLIIFGNVSILSKMLECLSTVLAIMSRDHSLYKDLVINVAGAMVMMTSKSNINGDIAAQVLVKYLLDNNNTLIGYFLIDVWSIWARFLPELQCYNLVVFWSKINDKFSLVQSIHYKSVHVKILLQNLYDLLSNQHKEMLWLSKPITTNIKLWTTLGLDRVPTNTKQQMADVRIEIKALHNTFLKEQTETALYKLIELLRLSETKSHATEIDVPDYLIQLWSLNFSQQTNQFSSLIKTLIRNSISLKRNLNNHQHYQILQTLKTIANTPNLNISLKVEILHYLRNISVEYFTVEYQNEILRTICQLFNKFLTDSDPIVKQLAFTVFTDVISLVKHDAITTDCLNDNASLKDELCNFIEKKRYSVSVPFSDQQISFVSQLESYSYQHNCVETKKDDVRLHTNDGNEYRVREIINRMQNDAKELIELNKIQKLSKEYHEDIGKITKLLLLE